MSVHQANTIVPLTVTVLMSWVHISVLASLDLLAMVKFAKGRFILYKSAKLLITLFTTLARRKYLMRFARSIVLKITAKKGLVFTFLCNREGCLHIIISKIAFLSISKIYRTMTNFWQTCEFTTSARYTFQ